MRKDVERLILQARRGVENTRKRREHGIVRLGMEEGLCL